VLDTNMIRNSSTEENVGKSMVLIHDPWVCFRARISTGVLTVSGYGLEGSTPNDEVRAEPVDVFVMTTLHKSTRVQLPWMLPSSSKMMPGPT
jgi:hypothetical protein